MGYGRTPLNEVNGTGLGIAYVQVDVSAAGVVQAANRRYFNAATGVYEPGPRDDAKHVTPYQRLSADGSDIDNAIQLAPVDVGAMGFGANVIAVVYNVDSSGKAVSVHTTYSRNETVALAAINADY